MSNFYSSESHRFQLHHETLWRPPQLGALGAAISHWSLDPQEPALVSIPTGAGKTAVAMAAPYIVPSPPRRVLVVVPSSDLRKQISDRFKSEHDLFVVSALTGKAQESLKVKRMTSRVHSWSELEDYDVVVALPNTISPRHYPDSLPPVNLFDLVIIDEAHHASAATWLEILQHFKFAYSLLLTATPIRRDGKQLPGKIVYYYPMRLALDAGIYKPLEPNILDPVSPGDKEATDTQIAEHCAGILSQDLHNSSTFIVRANTIDRAESLSRLYANVGINVAPLHSRLGHRQRDDIVNRLREGSLRGVAVVGMLGEGFDLGSIRLLAYHDKHKSLPATIQLFGRLARTDQDYPQPSVLVTVRDADIYPELQGVVRELYKEDKDWARVIPKIIDTDIQEERENAEFAQRFGITSGEIRPAHLQPLLRSVVYEISDESWEPFFITDLSPPELLPGSNFIGGQIVYSQRDKESGIFILVVKYSISPRWSSDPAVQDIKYQLHMLALKKAPTIDQRSLLFLNLESEGAHTALTEILGLDEVAQRIAPERIDDYVNSLERNSVSAVGVRNTNPAGRGTVGYRNFMGSGVDSGLRTADTSRAALGHGNIQINFSDGTSANGGFAVEKAKIWINRYLSLRQYAEWIEDVSTRIWYPRVGPSGPLLPGVDRGKRFSAWPTARPLAAEMSPQAFGRSYSVIHNGEEYPFEAIDLHILDINQPLREGDRLSVQAVVPDHESKNDEYIVVWEGRLEPPGYWTDANPVTVRRGYSGAIDFVDLLIDHPPTIFFLDGTTIIGSLLFESQYSGPDFDASNVETTNWIPAGVDITAETHATAARRTPPAVSIHEYLETFLIARPRVGISRWILQNDGSGEIADYIVIETLESGEIHMSLWHAKFAAGPAPSVRSGDFEKVVAQAIKSRRWLKRRDLWNELGNRLLGRASPAARVVEGSDDEVLLRSHLGVHEENAGLELTPWNEVMPVVRGNICIAQPGLSKSKYIDQHDSEAARSITQLLTVLSDTAQADALNMIVLGSAD